MLSFSTVADVLRATAGTDMAPATSAVIVAAGSSTRMGKGVSKQLLKLAGVPVLARTLRAFQQSGYIDEIVVVSRPEDMREISELLTKYGITKPVRLVAGGATRADSVKRGFAAISKKAKYVAIHDGARCLITPAMIKKVLRAAYLHRAATAACTVTDTVKIATKRGFIERTEDRERVWLAQTPQVFHTNLYRAALANVKDNTLTDDNQLIEAIGYPVKLVDCGAENLKITRPEDLPRAEAILAARRAKK
ncbi:MAG: 2-C-methyl-D-erythritol 4-phosphate cytidylyltransferase [Ruminococcaceae bacterium]|nr:2-C-methyl-D-erythritol 4-phosphate cytidylyltransferase [Oscillospiraceae bacterium]